MSYLKRTLLASDSLREPALPPGLQIEPIRSASAPTCRVLSLAFTSGVFPGVLVGGLYLLRFNQQVHKGALDRSLRTVSLVLSDTFFDGDPSIAQGGVRQRNFMKPQDESGISGSTLPRVSAIHTDLPGVGMEDLVPQTIPVEIPKMAQLAPMVAGGITSIGIGNGIGQGFGSGKGTGTGRGRGKTWIHSASSKEGIEVSDAYMDVQDYIPPAYPQFAVHARISGDVILEVTIDEHGKPIRWIVLEGHPCLATAALEVIPRWRFIAIRHQGQRVRATFDVRIRFTLMP